MNRLALDTGIYCKKKNGRNVEANIPTNVTNIFLKSQAKMKKWDKNNYTEFMRPRRR